MENKNDQETNAEKSNLSNKNIKVICGKNNQDHLGESSIWNHQKQILYWRDLEQGIIRSFFPR